MIYIMRSPISVRDDKRRINNSSVIPCLTGNLNNKMRFPIKSEMTTDKKEFAILPKE